MTGETTTLHVRRFPLELSARLDREAAKRGLTKQALVIELLTHHFLKERDR